jgi:uncharacterized protein YecA (UPF0149 family)
MPGIALTEKQYLVISALSAAYTVDKQEPYRRPDPKIGRNHPYPCGSGKKYKFCCLNKPANAAA